MSSSETRRRALFIVNVQVSARQPQRVLSRKLWTLNRLFTQNDFFHDGATPVPNVDAVLPVLNRLRAKGWTHVFVTLLQRPGDHWCGAGPRGRDQSDVMLLYQSWHFLRCSTFSSNHPGSSLGETVPCARAGGAVVVEPDACVQGSWGAALRRGLVAHESDVVVHYGFEPNSTSRECALGPERACGAAPRLPPPSYLARLLVSIFGDRSRNVSSLQYAARELGLNELYLAGISLDGAVLQVGRCDRGCPPGSPHPSHSSPPISLHSTPVPPCRLWTSS